MVPPRAGRDSYHHGDLPNALASAATEMARRGGPEAVVLREAARQVGVSAAAAYRHFAGHGDLLEAVRQRAVAALADALQEGLARGDPLGDPQAEVLRRLRNLGLAYVAFARANPGLFHTAFTRAAPTAPAAGTAAGPATAAAAPAGTAAVATAPAGAAAGPAGTADVTARIAATRPYQILSDSLDELVAVGLLDQAQRPVAPVAFWASIHGLATLLVDGPLADLPDAEQDRAVGHTLDVLLTGIGRRLA